MTGKDHQTSNIYLYDNNFKKKVFIGLQKKKKKLSLFNK